MSLAFVAVIPAGIGYWIDSLWGSQPVLAVVGMMFGLLAAGYLLWKLVRKLEQLQENPTAGSPEAYLDVDGSAVGEADRRDAVKGNPVNGVGEHPERND